MTVAIVFQGGSSLAAVPVGTLRALTDAGIRPDIVVGSSTGAINAVAFAQNPTHAGIDELRCLWSGCADATRSRCGYARCSRG